MSALRWFAAGSAVLDQGMVAVKTGVALSSSWAVTFLSCLEISWATSSSSLRPRCPPLEQAIAPTTFSPLQAIAAVEAGKLGRSRSITP